MKLPGYIAILLFGTLVCLSASTIRDVKILEASENIKYITQKIAKDYIYMYIYPNKTELKNTISDSIQDLEQNMHTIAVNTKDTNIKDVLDFFAYEKEQIKILIAKNQNKESASEVLDFSEAITEGAENIAKSIKYDFNFEEKMFMRSKNVNYLTEKLAKYYMVLKSDIDKTTISGKMKQTIDTIDNDVHAIQQYIYPNALETKKQDIEKLWNSNKYYYSSNDTLNVPSIVVLATMGMQNLMNEISIHHAKGN